MSTQIECKAVRGAMADLLFDPGAAPVGAAAHLEVCANCRAELDGLQGTMAALEQWQAPEPSPYWNARMGARLREEQAQPARGWAALVARLCTRGWVSNYTLKPVAGAAALGLALVAGGGTWMELASGPAAPVRTSAQTSATVRDLQSLNENAQLFQQLATLDGPASSTQTSN